MKNTLKIAFTILLVGFANLTIVAQQNISDKMFNDLRNNDQVTFLSFSKNLIDFVDFDVDSDNEDAEHKITGDLKEVKLVIYKPDSKPKIKFRDMVLKYLKKGKYKLIEDEDKDADDDTEVWVYRKGKRIYECHVIFQGEQNGAMLSFFGDFKVSDVGRLKEKINDYKTE